jgi:hypothetical protein
LGHSGVRPRPIRKAPKIIQQILPPTAIITTSDEAKYKSPVDPNKSKGSGISVVWKGESLTSPPMKKSSNASFKEKARGRSIGVGTEHAMILLGELHENESLSNLWDWERASKNEASLEAIPPIFQEQVAPSCPKPKNVEQFGGDQQGPPPSSRQNPHLRRPW